MLQPTSLHVKAASFIMYFLFISSLHGQPLNPGFDKKEYADLIYLTSHFTPDSGLWADLHSTDIYTSRYTSSPFGLDNQWQMWRSNDRGVISIRGTTAESLSWIANLYAAMVPAKGDLVLPSGETFHYNFTEDPQAAVHVGWLTSTGYIAKEVLVGIDSMYKSGIRQFVIIGHSQGGGISYLLTAHLRSLQMRGELPGDIKFKTYCSAAPKPGNLFFAYAYEKMTHGGWAYNVVNTADWVPEVPISIQTMNDFNASSPFYNFKRIKKSQKFPVNLLLGYVAGRLNTPLKKAQKRFQHYLGNVAFKQLEKQNHGKFTSPEFFKSNHYVRTGETIVLIPDESYHEKFTRNGKNEFWDNHHFKPYLYLVEKLP